MQSLHHLPLRSSTTWAILLFLLILACQPEAATAPQPTETALPPTATTVPPTATATPAPEPRSNLQGLTPECILKQRDSTELVVGALYPLSNLDSMINGFAMQAATNLAVSELNARGGVNGKLLRIITYDTGDSPEQGARFAERLITVDCVVAILAGAQSSVALAIKAIAVHYHIPVIFADPYADEITADQAPEVFRIAPTRTMLIEMMGKWLAEVGDYNGDGTISAVLLSEETPYGQSRNELAQKLLPQYGIQLEVFTVDLSTSNFSSTIARIVALPQLPDVIYLYLHDPATLSLQKALLEAKIGPTRDTLLVTLLMALDEEQFWQVVPDGNYTIVLHVGPWYSTVPALGQRFAQQFVQYFQRWPEGAAFAAYDSVWLIADAAERASATDADALIQALEQTDLTLAAGHYTFPYGSTNPPASSEAPTYLWHQWTDPPILYLQYTETNQPAAQSTVIWPASYRTINTPLAPALLEKMNRISHR